MLTKVGNAIGLAIARALLKQPKGNVTMLFITHALPKNLLVDEVVRIGAAPLKGAEAILRAAVKP